ncbi:MAG: cytochrome P450 [Gammaproteobacteria bacterium]
MSSQTEGGSAVLDASAITPPPAHVPPELAIAYEPQIDPDYPRLGWQVFARGAERLPPIFWSTIFGGGWVFTRAALVREAYPNWELFSSRNASQSAFARRLLPIDSDPPQHSVYRGIVSLGFAPRAVDRMEGWLRDIARDLVGAVAARGRCDFGVEIADQMPTLVFTRLMGLPGEEAGKYRGWASSILRMFAAEDRAATERRVLDELGAVIAARRREPREDLISRILGAEHEGHRLSDDEVLDFCYLLFLGGLDTLSSSMTHTFHLLARRPDKQAEIRARLDDPPRFADAVEELLRLTPTIRTARTVTRDVDFHGVPLRAGDTAVFHTGFANYDANEYPNPMEPDFDRKPLHVTFGMGPHRCLGAHLARREKTVLLQEWFRRIPSFRLVPGTDQHYVPGIVAVQNVQLQWDSAP